MVGSAISLDEFENDSFGELDFDPSFRTIVRTWPRMFDLGRCSSVIDHYSGSARVIQGCVPQLVSSDVVRIEQV